MKDKIVNHILIVGGLILIATGMVAPIAIGDSMGLLWSHIEKTWGMTNSEWLLIAGMLVCGAGGGLFILGCLRDELSRGVASPLDDPRGV